MENTEPESEFRSRSLGVGAPECDVKKWKTRSIKYGKHGVQNMENTEYKIWKTRSIKYGKHGVQNMENTESDVKYGKHGVRRIVSVKYGKQ